MAEQGTHEELLEQNGRYKELWSMRHDGWISRLLQQSSFTK